MRDVRGAGARARRKLFPLLGIAALLLVWQGVCAAGLVSAYVLPSPLKVWGTAQKMIASGEIARDVLVSLGRVLRGFGIAFALAFLLALLRIALPSSEPFYAWMVAFLRNVPPLSMIPLLILWCGIGETTKTVIIVLASFFPMYLAIVKGFTSYDPKLLEVARCFAYSPVRAFLRVMLPSAVSPMRPPCAPTPLKPLLSWVLTRQFSIVVAPAARAIRPPACRLLVRSEVSAMTRFLIVAFSV